MSRYKPYSYEEEFDPLSQENNRSPALDDDILGALARSSPEDASLVARYKEKMKGYSTEVDEAKKLQKYAGYADIAGQAFTDFGNAGKKDIILKNRMQDLGKRPDVVEAKRSDWQSIMPGFDRGVAASKSNLKDASDEFIMEDKLAQTDKARAREDEAYSRDADLRDPRSKASADAREYLKQVAPKSTSFPGYDNLSAAQVKEIAPGLYQAYNAQSERAARAADRAAAREQTAAIRDYTNQGKVSAAEAKQAEKMEQLRVGDLGFAQTAEDAKQLKTAIESKQSFDDRLDELISLRVKHNGGAMLNRDDVGRAKQLSKDLLLQYKDMAKLGVLSQSDEKILNTIIPDDPLQYNSPVAAIQGQDPTLYKLKKFKEDAEKDFSAKISNRLRREGRPAADAGAVKSANRGISHGSNLPD